MDAEEVKAELAGLLDAVSGWLRFAEAKNGALVAGSLALFVGLLPALGAAAAEAGGLVRAYFWFVQIQLLAASLLSITSFLPRTDLGRLLPREEKKDSDNLFFYGHLAKYTAKFLLAELDRRAGRAIADHSRSVTDLAEQVVMNSRIALWKFNCAKWSVRLFASALATPILVLATERVLNQNESR